MNCLQIVTNTEIVLLSTLCIRLRFINRFIDCSGNTGCERGDDHRYHTRDVMAYKWFVDVSIPELN